MDSWFHLNLWVFLQWNSRREEMRSILTIKDKDRMIHWSWNHRVYLMVIAWCLKKKKKTGSTGKLFFYLFPSSRSVFTDSQVLKLLQNFRTHCSMDREEMLTGRQILSKAILVLGPNLIHLYQPKFSSLTILKMMRWWKW